MKNIIIWVNVESSCGLKKDSSSKLTLVLSKPLKRQKTNLPSRAKRRGLSAKKSLVSLNNYWLEETVINRVNANLATATRRKSARELKLIRIVTLTGTVLLVLIV